MYINNVTSNSFLPSIESRNHLKSKFNEIKDKEALDFINFIDCYFNLRGNNSSCPPLAETVGWQVLHASRAFIDCNQSIQVDKFNYDHLSIRDLVSLYQVLNSYKINHSTSLSILIQKFHLAAIERYIVQICVKEPSKGLEIHDALVKLNDSNIYSLIKIIENKCYQAISLSSAIPDLRKIDKVLKINQLSRGHATTEGNNCLLDTIYQQISSYLEKDSKLFEFVLFVRNCIGKNRGEFLSINDEGEGVQILSAVQAYLLKKTSRVYGFKPTVLFADSEGDIAELDISEIVQRLKQGKEVISLKIIQVNYNHYEPIFFEDNPEGIEQLGKLSLACNKGATLPGYILNTPLKIDIDGDCNSSSSKEECDNTNP
ncbi:MAG: hypothetical protein H0V82_05205 [Candidatus Protochlamydia sp.]|nr:hypothetical protein [Candidatus Protochlamydia sp.]